MRLYDALVLSVMSGESSCVQAMLADFTSVDWLVPAIGWLMMKSCPVAGSMNSPDSTLPGEGFVWMDQVTLADIVSRTHPVDTPALNVSKRNTPLCTPSAFFPTKLGPPVTAFTNCPLMLMVPLFNWFCR